MFRKLRTISRCFFLFLGIIIAVSSTQLSFYVSAINHQFKTDIDNPTIGLLICKDKDNVVAKYALESYKEPMGISEYQLSKLFPKDFKSSMPTKRFDHFKADLQSAAVGFSYLQIRDAAFSLEADCKSFICYFVRR